MSNLLHFAGPVFQQCDLIGIISLIYYLWLLILLGLIATIIATHKTYSQALRGNLRQCLGLLIAAQYLTIATVIEMPGRLLFTTDLEQCGSGGQILAFTIVSILLVLFVMNRLIIKPKRILNKKGVVSLALVMVCISIVAFAWTGTLFAPDTAGGSPWWIRSIQQ